MFTSTFPRPHCEIVAVATPKPSVSAPRTRCGASNTPDSRANYKNVGPAPERFKPAKGQGMDVLGASLPVLIRMGSGALCYGYSTGIAQDDGSYSVIKSGGRQLSEKSQVHQFKRPELPLQLYEFEACPFCKKVREAVSILDLDVLVHPCPKEGSVWRPKAVEVGGKRQFPFLVDPNTGRNLYESDAIVRYLFDQYGPGASKIPLTLSLGGLAAVTAGLGLAARASKGRKALKSKQPEQPLVFWGYEGSPFVKLVREVLCELELPYLYRNAARGSPKRQELEQLRGHFQVPYLEDPNTESYLFESAAIIEYLQQTYGA